MTRLPLIAGNWKMNTTLDEARKLVTDMLPALGKIGNVERVICPPFISLAAVKELIKDTPVKLGAQNVYFQEKGAYTGEISPLMLAALCEYVVIGHSERRQYFNEGGDIISKKVRAVLKVGLKPILCVGEKLAENEAGQTEAVVSEQLMSSLEGVGDPDGLVIAYEPVWAIGTGRAATGAQANRTMGFIRGVVAERFSGEVAGAMRLLYGGSVTPENIAEFVRQPEIDGALVGGASLKADQFVSITRQTSEIRR